MKKFEDKIMNLNKKLLENIKNNLPKLEEFLNGIKEDDIYGDLVYRFYHGSFKVFWIQGVTEKIVKVLKELAPEECIFSESFQEILKDGTGKVFKSEFNENWGKNTRPLLEAFFHAKYFLEMAVKYGKELEEAPYNLPSGWAGLLELYGIR